MKKLLLKHQQGPLKNSVNKELIKNLESKLDSNNTEILNTKKLITITNRNLIKLYDTIKTHKDTIENSTNWTNEKLDILTNIFDHNHMNLLNLTNNLQNLQNTLDNLINEKLDNKVLDNIIEKIKNNQEVISNLEKVIKGNDANLLSKLKEAFYNVAEEVNSVYYILDQIKKT